jgi:excinuclease UvrABC helicase subunit UvrB
MNVEGRPDGKRPMGHPSLFEYHQARLKKHTAERGSDEGFALKAEECAKLQLEALQFHHRYICLLELQDYEGVIRDTKRNLAVFDFVARYAESEELAWALQQFRPQLLLIQIRAKGSEKLDHKHYREAIQEIERGITEIRQFYSEIGRNDIEHSAEVQYLENWITEVNNSRPLTKREKLEMALHEAVRQENYEKAAAVRDELRNLAED